MRYTIFDVTIQSDIELPELPASDADSKIRIKLGKPAGVDLSTFEHRFDWGRPGEPVICSVSRKEGDFLFVYPGSVRFHISASGVIHCMPEPGYPEQALRHILINQVIPRFLAEQGCLVIHASAVLLPTGKVVAFLGNSGFGKSTLAASFLREGGVVLADDCILLRAEQSRVRLIGAFPGLRLHPDSLSHVDAAVADIERVTPYTDKCKVRLNEGRGQRVLYLDAGFVLNDPLTPVDEIKAEPLTGMPVMMSLIDRAFSMDPSQAANTVEKFKNIGEIFSANVKLFRLEYPRSMDLLPDVHDAVLQTLENMS